MAQGSMSSPRRANMLRVFSRRCFWETVSAPVQAGDTVGKIVYRCGDEIIGEEDITASESVDKISFWGLFARMLQMFSLGA